MALTALRRVNGTKLERLIWLTQFCTKDYSTVDKEEIAHFKSRSNKWWDATNGPCKNLHTLNEIRVPFIVEEICKYSQMGTHNVSLPLSGSRILDVGGILSEALARKGAMVDGIDPCGELIKIAKWHAELSPLTHLKYYETTIEKHSIRNSGNYDAVVISEVIEHISEKEQFLKACIECIKPKGSLFVTTFNKTVWSWFVCVTLTQEVFNVIPRKTHDWEKFISHEDISKILKKCKCVD